MKINVVGQVGYRDIRHVGRLVKSVLHVTLLIRNGAGPRLKKSTIFRLRCISLINALKLLYRSYKLSIFTIFLKHSIKLFLRVFKYIVNNFKCF